MAAIMCVREWHQKLDNFRFGTVIRLIISDVFSCRTKEWEKCTNRSILYMRLYKMIQKTFSIGLNEEHIIVQISNFKHGYKKS